MILYAGTYTEMLLEDYGGHADGIYCYDFNLETGELHLLHTTPIRNPSYLCIHPQKQLLFSVEEVFSDKNPAINVFSIQKDHSLKFINQQAIPGGLPCHIEIVNKNAVTVACYEAGHLSVYPIAADGSLLEASSIIQHQGSSINQARQECGHAHVIAPDPSNGKIAVCDLGLDKVLFYAFNTSDNQLNLQKDDTVKIPAGHGPRHIAYHPGGVYAFVINELTATVSVLKKQSGKYVVQGTYAGLPEKCSDSPSGSAIRIHPNGRFVYSGNRGHDSIAIFQFDELDGSLKSLEHQLTGGKTVREFNLSPDGKWLLAAHQDSDTIVVFNVDEKTGLLEGKRKYAADSVVCLKWKI